MEEVEADARWRFLELSCSLARGNADELSDVDVGLGAAEGDWAQTLEAASAAVTGFGPVVAILRHDLGWAGPHQRLFVQYEQVQLDLVVFPAKNRKGLPPGAIALLDRDNLLDQPYVPPTLVAPAERVSEWAFLAWIAVVNICKYVSRGSNWEALAQLDQARGLLWQMWGARHDLPYPLYGLTTVLDAPEVGLPPGIESTLAGLDAAEITEAAEQLARILSAIAGEQNSTPMAAYAARRLEETAQHVRTN